LQDEEDSDEDYDSEEEEWPVDNHESLSELGSVADGPKSNVDSTASVWQWVRLHGGGNERVGAGEPGRGSA
jgi:hypothetical protein